MNEISNVVKEGALELTLRVEEPLKGKIKDYGPMGYKRFNKVFKYTSPCFYKLKEGEVLHLDNKKMLYAIGVPTMEVLDKARESKVPPYKYVVILPSGRQQEIYGWSMREIEEEYGLVEQALVEIKRDKVKVIKMERANSKHKWPMGTILYDKNDKPSSDVLLDALKEVSRGALGNTKPFTLVVEHTNGETKEVSFNGPTPNEDGHKWGLGLNQLAYIKKGNVHLVRGKNSLNMPIGTMIYSLNNPPSKEALDQAKQDRIFLECYINKEENKRVFYDRKQAIELFSPKGLDSLRKDGYLLTRRVKSIKGYPIGTIAYLSSQPIGTIDRLLEQEREHRESKKRQSTKRGATIRVENLDGSYKDYSHTHRGELLRSLDIWSLNRKEVLLDKYGKRPKIDKYALVYSIDDKRAPSDKVLEEARENRDKYIKSSKGYVNTKYKRVELKIVHRDGGEETKTLDVTNRLYYKLKKDGVYVVVNYSKNLEYIRGTKLYLKNS